ncbi:MAG: alpha/beta hydrolase [Candidatus Acetothermia bacterium]|jgi:pimeloyl-ACP methyl ester carboxylesterase|nr:alpha/beta hydrolase [Candidatus Acetothermia bacterium]MDH7504952.1 alpha/beta hydrolase [Candidatus Acetothermia bacterium]
MPTIELHRGKLHFSLSGRGAQDILLVHGSGADHTLWSLQVKALRDGFSVASVDLNGHGQSTWREGDGLATYTEDLLAVLERLSPRTFLVGHSLGGAVVLKTALWHPERVRAIGLVGTGARLRVLPQLLELLERDWTAAVELILTLAFGPTADRKIRERARRQMLKNGQRALQRDFLTCNSFDVMDKLDRVKMPALIVCGSADRLTPPRYSEYLRDHIPNATLRIIEGAGHMVMLEQPDELSRVLREFLAGLSP